MTMNRDKFDEIDKMFESLEKANDETLESFKERLSGTLDNQKDLVDYKKDTDYHRSPMVRRPTIPDQINASFDTRLDYFLYFIKNVNYGVSNNGQYVHGHVRALNQYLEHAKINHNYLSQVEAVLKDELERYVSVSKNTLDIKGYYDGLNYVNKALKKSKEIMASKINAILKKELQ